MDTEYFNRINDLVTFQQRFKTNLRGIYEDICEISKRMEKTENVNEIFRDENYELTSANETQNTIIQTFKQEILIKEDQLKKLFFTPFTVSHQRTRNSLTPNNLVELAMNSNFTISI